MKYIKTYKKQNIKIGDYVIIKTSIKYLNDFNKFLKNHIGQITEVSNDIYVKFLFNENDSVKTKHLYNYVVPFKTTDIKFSSDNLEDLKIKLNAEKYNL